MDDRRIFESLADSTFLAGLGERDRSPLRILGTLFGGLLVGFVAAGASGILVLIGYILITGQGGAGAEGLSKLAVSLQDETVGGLDMAILRLTLASISNGAFVLAFIALAAILAGHRFRDYISAAPRPRWRLLVTGLVLSALVLAPVLLTDRFLADDHGAPPILSVTPGLLGRAAYALAALLFIPAAAAEEAFFRGWLLRQTAAFSREPVLLIVATAVAFSALHFDFSAGAFITRVVMGAGFAYMTLRLGGIEFSTGVHAANNILIVLFIEPLTLKATQSAAEFSAGSLIEDVALAVGYLIITEAVVRLAPLRRLAGVRQQDLTRSAGPADTFA